MVVTTAIIVMTMVIPAHRRIDHIAGTAVIPIEAGPRAIATIPAVAGQAVSVGTVIAARIGIAVAGTAAVVAAGAPPPIWS